MKSWKTGWIACAVVMTANLVWAEDQRPGRMTAQEVSKVFKATNQALSEGIAAAERHVGGKAIEAECFGETGDAKGPICQVTVLTSDNKLIQTKVGEAGKVLGQTNVTTSPGLTSTHVATLSKNNISVIDCLKAAERHTNGKAVLVEAITVDNPTDRDAACMVTLLTDNNQLVQASITNANRVIGQQNVDAVILGTGFAVAPGLTSKGTTMDPNPGSADRVVTTADRPQGSPSLVSSADDFAKPRRVQKATDLRGKNVTNNANENLGELQDIVIDAASGRILYGVLSFGGVLGLGDKYFAIPWRSMTLAPNYKNFVLNIDKNRLKDAQGFNKDQWPNFADERWATTTHQQFDQKPYWKDVHGTALGSEAGNRDSYRQRWYQQVTNWKKTSSLVGANLKDAGDKDMGEVNDLIIDPDQGRVIFAIISHEGKLYPVPFSSVHSIGAGNDVTVKIDPSVKLQESVAFNNRDWPDMADSNWPTHVFSTYNAQPYWMTGGKDKD